MRTINTVIIKPTKGCNADCSYCCAPPDGAPKWDIEDFTRAFSALEPRLHPAATLIWHGGEPMLLGPDFYIEAYTRARSALPNIRFSMQSNILSYNRRWNQVFRDVFEGSISTSWDPDEICRTVKGRAKLYARLFHSRLHQVLDDGWRPKVISTFTDETIHLAHEVYERALASDRSGRTYDIRLNYRFPAGRADRDGPALLPESYGATLVEIYNRWIADLPGFLVTPLDQMLKQVIGIDAGRCPWAKGCTGRILGLEPNFDIYNCGEFADLADPAYRFGNLLEDGINACLTSPAARALARRQIDHPASCKTCLHYRECEGGCMRDSVLFGEGIYGKFHYCESWQILFSRIKESILTGEADGAISRMGEDPGSVRARVSGAVRQGLDRGLKNMRRPVPQDAGSHMEPML